MYSLILHGRRRSLELQKWRNLKLLQTASAYSKSASAAPQDGRKEKTFTVSYLVDSLGFTRKLAESISRKVISEGKGSPDSVLSLLEGHGFIVDAEKSLAPKLQFLQSRGGATTSELTEILTKVPKMLGIKKEKAISVYYDFVKEIIEADKSSKFETLCHSSLQQGSMQENKIRNVLLVLRELGVPQKLLFSSLISDHRNICCGKKRFEDSLKKVAEMMGFDPKTSRFIEALHAVYQLSDKTIQEKVSVYQRLGFVEGDVWAMFKKWPCFMSFSEINILNSMETFLELGFTRDEFTMMVKRFPSCIGSSAETVKKKTEYLVKQMNWPLKSVASHPQVFSYSMEKRIVPRCNVIKALMSKGLLGKGSELPSVSTVMSKTNQTFLNKHVRDHDDKELVSSPEIMLHRSIGLSRFSCLLLNFVTF